MATKEEVAEQLARDHYLIEPEINKIFLILGNAADEKLADEPIKLLEVNQDTIPTGILPLHFPPHPARGLTYPCIIVEITPEEFEELQKGKLALPNGWYVGRLFQRPTQAEKNGA